MLIESKYEELFNRFEYFIGWVQFAETQEYGYVGEYCYHYQRNPVIENTFGGELDEQGDDWLPLRSGFFGGSRDKALETKVPFDGSVNEVRYLAG